MHPHTICLYLSCAVARGRDQYGRMLLMFLWGAAADSFDDGRAKTATFADSLNDWTLVMECIEHLRNPLASRRDGVDGSGALA